MISVFKFMMIWDKLSQEEKDYLDEEFGWSKYSRDRDDLKEHEFTELEESLISKGVLKKVEEWSCDTFSLQICDDLVWIFEGLRLTANLT